MSNDDDKGNHDDYTPIACGLYSEYEVAIMQRKTLHLHWRDANAMDHLDHITPKDLQTRNHCEYLIAENSEGATLEIRLDRILSRTEEPQ